MISFSGCICNSLNARQINSVGRVFEYCPPMYFNWIAWSRSVAAFRGMQNSFQYCDSYIRSRIIFSIKLYSQTYLNKSILQDSVRGFGL